MTGRRLPPRDPDRPDGFDSRREARVWLAIYVVVMIVLAAGAARRIYLMF